MQPDILKAPKNVQRWLANPDHPPIPPVEYAGKWIVWDRHRTMIVAHGNTMQEAVAAAEAGGHVGTILHRVPPVEEIFIGVR